MQVSFQCPACFEVHDEPFSAEYVLAVRCEACTLELEWRSERLIPSYNRAA